MKPITRMPAATPPVTPATESSMTMASAGLRLEDAAPRAGTRPAPACRAPRRRRGRRRHRGGSGPRARPCASETSAARRASWSRCSADRRARRASRARRGSARTSSPSRRSVSTSARRISSSGNGRPSSSPTSSKMRSVVKPGEAVRQLLRRDLVAELPQELAIHRARTRISESMSTPSQSKIDEHGAPCSRLSPRGKARKRACCWRSDRAMLSWMRSQREVLLACGRSWPAYSTRSRLDRRSSPSGALCLDPRRSAEPRIPRRRAGRARPRRRALRAGDLAASSTP